MESFEILCTTMHQNDFSKIKEMNIHSDVVFANQCDHTSYEELEFEGHTAKMISTSTRGVGINRNLTLSYASADICLLADDDVRYCDDMKERVLSEFERHPDADVIAFNFTSNTPGRVPVKYDKTKKLSKFSRMPFGAVRIAFRLNSIKKANVWFATLFGGGAIFPSGEDSIFLKDLKKAGLVFYVSREFIGEIDYSTSSWFTGYDEKYFYGIGACYTAMKRGFVFKYLYTLYRTRGKSALSSKEKIKWLRNGKKGYKIMLSYDEFKNYIKRN